MSEEYKHRGPDAIRAYTVMDLIEKHQDALNMGVWAATRASGASRMFGHRERFSSRLPVSLQELTADSCGTVACFAGWTVAAAGHTIETYGSGSEQRVDTPDGPYVPVKAAELLGLDEEAADRLFYHTDNRALPGRIRQIFGEDPRPTKGAGHADL